MTPFELLGFEENARRLEARRTLRELSVPRDGRMSVDGIYELVLAETDDANRASSAAGSYAAALLRSGQTPT